MVIADLGLPPWVVLHQGISRQTGIPIGTVGIITGLIVLLLWIPLGQRIGIGTVTNVIVVGVVLDLTLLVLPSLLSQVLLRWAALLSGILLVAIGTGLYIGVGWGPGPRDGLMTGIAALGVPIWVGRGAIEITVLVFGWFLGGTVGLGTVLFAFGIGPLVHLSLRWLTLPVRTGGTAEPGA